MYVFLSFYELRHVFKDFSTLQIILVWVSSVVKPLGRLTIDITNTVQKVYTIIVYLENELLKILSCNNKCWAVH